MTRSALRHYALALCMLAALALCVSESPLVRAKVEALSVAMSTPIVLLRRPSRRRSELSTTDLRASERQGGASE
jgi:hypothetical protein